MSNQLVCLNKVLGICKENGVNCFYVLNKSVFGARWGKESYYCNRSKGKPKRIELVRV